MELDMFYPGEEKAIISFQISDDFEIKESDELYQGVPNRISLSLNQVPRKL